MSERRAEAADYYDFGSHHPNDLPFYISQLPGSDASVLELGCGTGRISIPLAEHCGVVYGLDHSHAMIRRLSEKLESDAQAPRNLKVEMADITAFSLDQLFDLIIAPFRVLQNVIRDAEVEAVFERISEHLEPGGICILNVFNPNQPPEAIIELWSRPGESKQWEVRDGADRVECHVRRSGVDQDPLVFYPTLIYRRFREDLMTDEATLEIGMRCYYPEEFLNLIEGRGFRVVNKWGGYQGEPYGEGSELVVAFGHGT